MPSKSTPLPPAERGPGREKKARLLAATPWIFLPRTIAISLHAYFRTHARHSQKTARIRSIQKFGKPLLEMIPKHKFSWDPHTQVGIVPTEFESPVGIGVQHKGKVLGALKLGFAEKTVFIEAIQGLEGREPELHTFNEHTRLPWPNYLLQIIEHTARRAGYQSIQIRDPVTLYHYKQPAAPAAEWPIIQRRMREMYGLVAHRMGYHRKGDVFSKEL